MISLREERDGTDVNPASFPRVRYRTASGQEVEFESGMGSAVPTWSVGQRVAVRYDPDDPLAAELDSVAALWGPTALFAALAAVFLGVGVAALLGLIPA